MTDRYLKVILTVIALELLWIGVKDLGTPLAAQATRPPSAAAAKAPAAPIPVVIKAVEMDAPPRGAMPIYSTAPLSVEVTLPVKIEADQPIAIVGGGPVKVEADKPIPVETVRYVPGKTPGE